jgi:hypothetical protein
MWFLRKLTNKNCLAQTNHLQYVTKVCKNRQKIIRQVTTKDMSNYSKTVLIAKKGERKFIKIFLTVIVLSSPNSYRRKSIVNPGYSIRRKLLKSNKTLNFSKQKQNKQTTEPPNSVQEIHLTDRCNFTRWQKIWERKKGYFH